MTAYIRQNAFMWKMVSLKNGWWINYGPNPSLAGPIIDGNSLSLLRSYYNSEFSVSDYETEVITYLLIAAAYHAK